MYIYLYKGSLIYICYYLIQFIRVVGTLPTILHPRVEMILLPVVLASMAIAISIQIADETNQISSNLLS